MMKAIEIQTSRIKQHSLPMLWPALALLIAMGLNYGLDEGRLEHYNWLLQPIVWLLEGIQGQSYAETPAGYLIPEGTILVAPNCAGLRFLGLALIGGAVLIRGRSWQAQLQNFLLLLPVAYGLTILASFARILLWMKLQSFAGGVDLLEQALTTSNTAGNPHALMGFIIYIMFFVLASAIWPRMQKESD